jgi:hypothetical protein
LIGYAGFFDIATRGGAPTVVVAVMPAWRGRRDHLIPSDKTIQ